MDKRIRIRQSLVRRDRARRRATIALLGLLAVAGLGLFLWARSSEVFAVDKVVASGVTRVSSEELRQVLSWIKGKNLLCLSTREVAQAVEAVPYVRAVAVWRRFPDTLEVHIREYQPVARIQVANDACWLVGDDGRVLEKAISPRGLNLPLVIMPGIETVTGGQRLPGSIARALSVVNLLGVDQFREVFTKLATIKVDVDGTVTILLEDHTEVRLGEPTDLERKLMVATRVLENSLRVGRELEYVDVAVPDRAVAKPR